MEIYAISLANMVYDLSTGQKQTSKKADTMSMSFKDIELVQLNYQATESKNIYTIMDGQISSKSSKARSS